MSNPTSPIRTKTVPIPPERILHSLADADHDFIDPIVPSAPEALLFAESFIHPKRAALATFCAATWSLEAWEAARAGTPARREGMRRMGFDVVVRGAGLVSANVRELLEGFEGAFRVMGRLLEWCLASAGV